MLPFPHPFLHFDEWFAAARVADPQPEAASLATVAADGQPENRMVLVRHWPAAGFDFYSDRGSRKGRALAAHPRAALCWHWKGLGRQVRAEGLVVPITEAESDAYWAARPRQSRLSAITSWQSREVEGRAALLERLHAVEVSYAGRDVPRPARWGGFRLVPLRVEFWQHDEFRFHDRLEYARTAPGAPWRTRTLEP